MAGCEEERQHLVYLFVHAPDYPHPLSSKWGGLVISVGKVVDFYRLAVAVPIRLQNEITCTHDILSTQQKIVNSKSELISVDYTLKVGEKQFSDVQKRHKSRESMIKVCCSWFAGQTCSPYFAAPTLHVQSVSRNSTQLRMPRIQGAKL